MVYIMGHASLRPCISLLDRRYCQVCMHDVRPCVRAGDRALLSAGGRGGRGNASFKTARNNAPAMAEHGAAGSELWLDLELKLVADVGIVGVPNAGKSTLLSVVRAFRVDYCCYASPSVGMLIVTHTQPRSVVCAPSEHWRFSGDSVTA